MSSEVIVRLGSHAEKDYLLKTLGLFSGTVIGANLLEMTPGATVSLAWKVRTAAKQFLIDPMTYVFAIDLDYISSETIDKKTGKSTRDIKRSFRNFCVQLGDPVKDIVLNRQRSLTPADFQLPEDIAAISTCTAKYQLERMKGICAGDPQLKEFAEETVPSAIFSPYFYIPADNVSTSKQWEDVCLRIIDYFGASESPKPKHAVLCLARRILKDQSRLARILDRVMASGCDACWIWFSTLKEEDITETEMNNLVLLVKQAKGRDFPLWNMHGGFLSALLSKHGLTGFSHSIGYGESKDVLPVSGGSLPTVAYHYNPLHVRASVPDIERAFSSIGVYDALSFHDTICDCVICKGVLKGDLRNFGLFGELVLKPNNKRASQTAESAKRCRFHFLLARKIELDLVDEMPLEGLLTKLGATVSDYRNLGSSIQLRDKAQALSNWIKNL
jgi:hypothetical protein